MVGRWTGQVALWVFFLGAMQATDAYAGTLRAPTLDDAMAAKRLGRVSLAPNGKSIAVEFDGNIEIRSASAANAIVGRFEGGAPVWSPDGRQIAYFFATSSGRQLFVHDLRTGKARQITTIPGGISPTPFRWVFDDGSEAVAWSPDSARIAFTTRVAPSEQTPRQGSPKIRVMDKDTPYAAIADGVFRTDFWDVYAPGDPDLSAERMLPIQAHPEIGRNKLFVVDVARGVTRQLTSENQYFSPSWSPDGEKIVTVVDETSGVSIGGPASTRLAIVDARTGAARPIPMAFRYVANPQWSPDGEKILFTSKARQLGFRSVHLFLPKSGATLDLRTPLALSAVNVRWAGRDGDVALRLADRFVDSLWRVSTRTGKAARLIANDPNLIDYAVGDSGRVVFTAQGPYFPSKLFVADDPHARPREILDPNPQLAELRFGEQRRVTWRNGSGEEVDGIVILPPGYQPGRRYPLIVDVYPGQTRDRFNLRASPRSMGQLEAALGYVVFLPGLRAPHAPGSFSRDAQFTDKSRGPKGIPIMLDEFQSGIRHLDDLGMIDRNRSCIYGHSNGGYVANFLITELNIRCAVVSSGASNLIWEYYTSPPNTWPEDVTSGKDISASLDEYIAMSPLLRMDRVKGSTLLIVGDHDWWPWLPEMMMQFAALKRAGKPVTWIRYTDEAHIFVKPENIRDSLDRVHRFIASNMGS